MRISQPDRRNISRNIFYGLIIFALVVAAGYLLYSNWRLFKKWSTSLESKNMAAAKLLELSEQEVALSIKVAELQTENGLEKEIRERLPVAKPGEEVIMIVPSTAKDAAIGESVSPNDWWNKFLDFFKN